MQEQILAALKKLGPSSPGQIAAELGIKAGNIGYHVKKLLDADAIKAAGTSNARRLALPEQDFAEPAEAAPPQRRKTHKRKAGRKAKHARTPRAKKAGPRARPAAAAPTERFIPAVDQQSRLIIVNGAEPHIFSEAQTEAIASLLFQHYDKA